MVFVYHKNDDRSMEKIKGTRRVDLNFLQLLNNYNIYLLLNLLEASVLPFICILLSKIYLL